MIYRSDVYLLFRFIFCYLFIYYSVLDFTYMIFFGCSDIEWQCYERIGVVSDSIRSQVTGCLQHVQPSTGRGLDITLSKLVSPLYVNTNKNYIYIYIFVSEYEHSKVLQKMVENCHFSLSHSASIVLSGFARR